MKAELKFGCMETRVFAKVRVSAIPRQLKAKHVPTEFVVWLKLRRFRVYKNVDNSLYIKYNYTHVPLRLIGE